MSAPTLPPLKLTRRERVQAVIDAIPDDLDHLDWWLVEDRRAVEDAVEELKEL